MDAFAGLRQRISPSRKTSLKRDLKEDLKEDLGTEVEGLPGNLDATLDLLQQHLLGSQAVLAREFSVETESFSGVLNVLRALYELAPNIRDGIEDV